MAAAEADTAAPTAVTDRGNDVWRPLGRMLAFSRPYLWWIGGSAFFALFTSLGRYGRVYLMKPLLDDVFLADLTMETALASPAFKGIVAGAIAIVIVMPIALFARAYLQQYALRKTSMDIKKALARKLLSLPLAYHQRSNSGDTLSRALNDARTAEVSIHLVYDEFLIAVVMIIIGMGTMVAISPPLALISFLSAPVIVGILGLFARRIRRTARRRQEQLGEVTQRLVAILSGIKVIKAFRGETLEGDAFENETDKLFRRSMKVVKNRVLSRALVEMLNNGVAVGMIILGAVLVLQGRWGLTPGDIAAFAGVLATTYKPVKDLSKGWAKMAESLSSAERFFKILDTSSVVPDAPDAVAIDGVRESIRFRNVGYAYDREPVLQSVSLDVKPGEVIAIVGRTGSGKTTLMDLLLRFDDVDGGAIEVDGRDVRQITRHSFLDQVAVVTQEPFLFDATIRENIGYGRPGASEAEIREAAVAAHVDEFVDHLPEGYDTQVGEFGTLLSGGQRQRITIARAILKDPSILVFDEATSSLDAKTERTVQDAIDSLRGKRTVFVIAHRLSTIRGADRIVVLEQGRVSQEGTHEELQAQSGLYRELVGLQTDPLHPEAPQAGTGAAPTAS